MEQPLINNLNTFMYPTELLHTFGVSGKVSGSIGAIGEMSGVLPIIHGPRGCGFHYRYSARRRHEPFYNVLCSNLEDSDIIFGGGEKLRATIKNAWERYKPKLIVIIPTPVSDLLSEDTMAVAMELRQENIPVITIQSELFSHRDKNYSANRIRSLASQKITGENKLEMEPKGCGFTEALYTIVEQAMVPCEIIPRSVNIETVGWGSNGNVVLYEIEAFLNECGITVNTWIPSAPIEDIIKAPAAQLNLVKRIRWARRMKEKFKTEYIHLGGAGRYTGIDGISAFYLDIGKSLQMEEDYIQKVNLAKEEALSMTEKARQELGRYQCTLICKGLQNAPFQLKLYAKDMGLNINHVCLILTPEASRNMALTEDLKDKLMNRVEDAVELYSQETKIHFNPGEEELKNLLSETDAIVGTKDFTFEKWGIPVISNDNELISLSFPSYIRNVHKIKSMLEMRVNHKDLILNRMPFNSRHFPLYENKDSLAGKEMWARMWLDRKEETK